MKNASPAYRRLVWTPAMKERMRDLYGSCTARALAARLSREFEVEVTTGKVTDQARRLGLDFATNQGKVSIAAIARELRIDSSVVSMALERLGITPRWTGHANFLNQESAAKVRAHLGDRAGTVSSVVAAKRLGVSHQTAHNWMKSGLLPSRRCGKLWRVPVEALVQRDGFGNVVAALPWVTVAEAAPRFGVSREGLNYRLLRGQVPGAFRVDRFWRIPVASLPKGAAACR